jgi:ribosomal silencing factor RsfS
LLNAVDGELPKFVAEEELFGEKFSGKSFRREDRSSNWHVIDFGGLMVHLMMPQTREFYDLERIWFKAKPIKF